MLTLLDTHAWVWWATEDRRLSAASHRAIRQASASGALALSLISIWEVAKKVEKAQLVLDRPVDDWIDQAVARPGLQLLELTRPILIESCRLPGPFHGDPADQMLVASARRYGAVLVTKNQQIRRYRHVQSIW